jgi:hypothetical protein
MQPGKEVVGKQLVAAAVGLPAQIIDFSVAEAPIAHPLEKRLETGIDAVARLMIVIVRVATKEVVELDKSLMQSQSEIDL